MHAAGVLHRDLKSPNILIGQDRAVLADFGLAKIVSQADTAAAHTRGIGTVHWMAPEVIAGCLYASAADVYGLGCVFVECITLKLPWAPLDSSAIVRAVADGRRVFEAAPDAGEWERVADAMTSHVVRQRPTVQRVLEIMTSLEKAK